MPVTTGFSRPHIAKYSNEGQTVTYSDPVELARGVEFSIEVETPDDNNFYANNVVAETEPAQMTSGTVTLTVDGLSGEEEALILGITSSPVSYNEEQVEVIKYGSTMNPPYLALGGIKRTQLNGSVSYRPIVLTKVRFSIPPEAAVTQEDQIDWQTQELTATIMRDDTLDKTWKIIPKTGFPTEEEAVNFMLFLMGKTQAAG